MEYLEVHDPQKYRLRARGIVKIPFFMKGKYGLSRNAIAKRNQISQSSTDGDHHSDKLARRKKIIDKEKLERIRQYKLKSRNKQGGVAQTMSPNDGKNKLNNSLLKHNKTRIGLKQKEEKESHKVTLEILQQMNLKELNYKQRRYDDFKPKDIMTDEDMMEDDNSVFNYFSPKTIKKAKVKKTTTNKFTAKRAVIKEPDVEKTDEDEEENYYTEGDKKTGDKSRKSKVGNMTSRAGPMTSAIKGSSNTRRNKIRGALTGRGNKKSMSRSKSKSKKSNKFSPNRKKGVGQKESMLKRAAQIDKINKNRESNKLNKVLKMHDKKMKSGLNVLRRK